MFLLHFLLENGVGQNLTAGALGLALGWLWARAQLKVLHARHDEHAEHVATVGRSLADLHEKLDAHGQAIEALHQRVSGDARAARPPRPRAPRTPKP